MKLASVFSDHAVLQREISIPVWGWTEPGTRVVAELGGVFAATRSRTDGKFLLRLPPMKAGGPFELNVSGGGKSVVVRDVLIGEVWVASGQSNMEWTVAACGVQGEETIQAATNEWIRMLTVPRKAMLGGQGDVDSDWLVSSPDAAGDFSAVAYHFASRLQDALDVPVGILSSSWGGTIVETWTSREALIQNPDTQAWTERYEATLNTPEFWDDQQEGVQPPQPPMGPNNPNSPYMLFENMIVPLLPYAIRGAIWYQGESNANRNMADKYRGMLVNMIRDWRRAWGQGDFPFIQVQLANYVAANDVSDMSWPLLREAQLQAVSEPGVGMATIIDIGEANDIHPKNKLDVGRRLAQWALVKTYGREGVASGPLYSGMAIEGRVIRLRFENVGSGLVAQDGEALSHFVVAGLDREFHPASATLEGSTVIVQGVDVPEPVAVRYAWADNPEGCNLYNRDGFPASPFRTDSW